jgi:integrase
VPTLPYTADEMTRILAACDRYRGDKDRIRAFILVMRYAGLRISDTIKLHADQRIEHRLRLYTTQTGQPVYVPLPPFVVEALEKIERPGHRYFWTGRAKLSTGRANWSRYLASVFRLAKVENGRSHRFRDTFSTSLLEQAFQSRQLASSSSRWRRISSTKAAGIPCWTAAAGNHATRSGEGGFIPNPFASGSEAKFLGLR